MSALFQIEREVTETMMKSLRYCDLQTESARQPLYQYRAATIHHRLASMYHSCYRNQVQLRHLQRKSLRLHLQHTVRLNMECWSSFFCQVGDESVRKQHKALAEQHYSKAVRLFISLRDAPCELLRTLLERVAFAEFTMAVRNTHCRKYQLGEADGTRVEPHIGCFNVFAGQNSSAVKQKTLTGALEVMCETRHAFKLIHKELLELQKKVYQLTYTDTTALC